MGFGNCSWENVLNFSQESNDFFCENKWNQMNLIELSEDVQQLTLISLVFGQVVYDHILVSRISGFNFSSLSKTDVIFELL